MIDNTEIYNTFASTFKPKREPLKQHTELFPKMIGQPAFALLMDPGTAKSYAVVTEASFLYTQGLIDLVFVIAPSGVDDEWKTTHFPENCTVPNKVFVWEGLNSDAQKRRLSAFVKTPFDGLKVFAVRIDAFSRNTHIELFKSIINTHKTYTVLDEGHTIKNPESNRADNIVHGINKGSDSIGVIPYSFDFKGNRKHARKVVTFISTSQYRRVLTGTLISKSPINVWSPFQFLQYGIYRNYFAFKNAHVIQVRELIPGRVYNRPIKFEEIERIRIMSEAMEPDDIAIKLHISESNVRYILNHPELTTPYRDMDTIKQIMDQLSYYCRLEDVVDIAVNIHSVVVPMSENQRRIYAELKRDRIADLGDKSLVVTDKIALITRFSQVASGLFRPTNARMMDGDGYDDDNFENLEDDSDNVYELELIDTPTNKYLAVLNLINGWYETDNNPFDRPLVIACRFVAEIEMFITELSKAFPTLRIFGYYGKTTTAERAKIKHAFKEGGVDILVVNPSTAGTGLNLQRGNKMILVSSDYDYMKRKQLIGREVRTGQDSTVNIWKLLSEGTIDERIEAVLTQNAELSEYFRTASASELV